MDSHDIILLQQLGRVIGWEGLGFIPIGQSRQEQELAEDRSPGPFVG